MTPVSRSGNPGSFRIMAGFIAIRTIQISPLNTYFERSQSPVSMYRSQNTEFRSQNKIGNGYCL